MPTDDVPAIRVTGLRRSYGSGATAFEAVRGVDLEVRRGTITALLGTNGAGKTSTLEVIEGLAQPSAGTVEILGLDPIKDRAQVRRQTGVLLQRSGFPGDLTVQETLQLWHGTLSDPRPVAEAMAMLRLEDRADVRVRGLSGGQQRRLDLACTLMGRPSVVLLDEPTTGLDPESRRDVWRLVQGLRDEGTTIIVTTHYLEEAEQLADRLEIMHDGLIVRAGTPAEIAEGHPSSISFVTPPDTGWLAGLPVRRIAEDRGITEIATDDLQGTLTDLLGRARDGSIELRGLQARTASLESVFLDIASGGSRGDDGAGPDGPDDSGRGHHAGDDPDDSPTALTEGAAR